MEILLLTLLGVIAYKTFGDHIRIN